MTSTPLRKSGAALVRSELNPLLDQAPKLKKELAPLQEKTAKALEEYAEQALGVPVEALFQLPDSPE